MPVAGGTVETRLCRLDGDRLVDFGKHRALSFVAVDVEEAIVKLDKGQTVNLKFIGDNWDRLKAHYATKPPEPCLLNESQHMTPNGKMIGVG